MNVTELRQRANQALARAQELQTSLSDVESPSAGDEQAIETAMSEAENLFNQADQIEARSNRFRDLEQRGRQPAGRLGQPILPHQDAANTRNGRHGYSVLRAIRGQLEAAQGRGVLDGIEGEVHQELALQRSSSPQGVLIPWDVQLRGPVVHQVKPQYRDLTTSTGSGAIPTIVVPTMIDLLRSRLVTASLGATIFTDMSQPFALPVTTAGPTGYWVSEGTAPTNSNPTIGQVSFSPKTAGAVTKLSRKFIAQSSVDAESYAVSELVKTVALFVETAVLTADGTNNAPTGLLNISGTNLTALGTNGANPTYLNLLAMTGAVNAANAPDDSRAWLFNSATIAYLSGAPQQTGYPVYIYDAMNKVCAGYNVASTNILPANITKGSGTNLSAAIFGDWSELVIAMFSGIDVLVDPYSDAGAGNVRIVALQDVDTNVKHAASFSVCKDIKTS